ncbi:MAG: thiosulfate/3-mercaptopyruvate sulfurtransferase [Acidobacteriota bacterium]|jgi:thiosulfate/3-mercaptopyruvate sulfurtransferase|nr:thiosulfate/3-mercaptopyruvate sulfurtransferase [Acidobacteriota bacterium]
MRKTLLVTLILLFVPALFAATPRESLLVDAAWLKQHIKDPDLVLLQVGDPESFDAAHIAGARKLTLQDIHVSEHTPQGLILEMLPAEELRTRLEALGISDRSRIIVYYGKDWVSPTTRILLTLQYAGLGARASMLDGGLAAWQRAGGAVTKEASVAKKGKLSPLHIQPLVVDGQTVRARLGTKGYAVVDGRASVFYDGVEAGEDHGGVKQRLGHVRGALSIPYTDITTDDLHVKPTAELRAMFDKAGVKPGDTVIGYCHIGMQTTAMLLAARILGHDVLLYDGSYQDWSRHADYPVETAP